MYKEIDTNTSKYKVTTQIFSYYPLISRLIYGSLSQILELHQLSFLFPGPQAKAKKDIKEKELAQRVSML